ncbi:MAG: elongation factor 4 [Deltaproteobacteria bacterium]|nr:elongation factor 4 [Deltaproteobacteria bacterium]MCB9480062.1 elongation factor 4 [Deltaproteobacteria bacterium]MCB9487120.1 elongation factor 4 [Deltaproteobacteria bacterium]
MAIERIRNFSIIAHIDHGKSTLADRLMEITGVLTERTTSAQYLDKMDIEQERGITIKAQTARLPYKAKDGHTYYLNLIDTPGHVDFGYEVSRSLSACEGTLLVVDATKGVEAQTLANAYLAVDLDLEVVPVLNKVDLATAEPERVREDIEEMVGLDASDSLEISAKTGVGVAELLEVIVKRIPPPQGSPDAELKAIIFDSWYDSYQGVVALIRVFEGQVKVGDKIRLMAVKKEVEVAKLGYFSPDEVSVKTLSAGDVGFLTAGIKDIGDAKVGDTVTHAGAKNVQPFPGFRELKPMVFAGLYPTEATDYESLKAAIEKLNLNDTAFRFEPETSVALGFGFRCGFLGLLHMEIIQERLEREFDQDLVVTAPTVVYNVIKKDGTVIKLQNPSQLPEPIEIERIEEPIVKANIHVPAEYLGNVLTLCQERRGVQRGLHYHSRNRVVVEYELPMAEIVFDFFDKLKTATKGFASLDYDFFEYRADKLVKLDILVNGEPLDALSLICHDSKAYYIGRELSLRLRKTIPRQMYEVVIQAAIGTRIIARERIAPLRKNVTAKCYGGDITRKRKLLEKQKEGKKRMKRMGNVEIPQEAFLAVLSVKD